MDDGPIVMPVPGSPRGARAIADRVARLEAAVDGLTPPRLLPWPTFLPGPGEGGTALVRAPRGRWHWYLVSLGAAAGGVLGLLLPAAVVVPLLVAGVVLARRWSRQGEDEPTARTVRRETRG